MLYEVEKSLPIFKKVFNKKTYLATYLQNETAIEQSVSVAQYS